MNDMAHILIIDDDEGLVHFLSRFFQRKGYDVTACLTGKEALAAQKVGGLSLALGHQRAAPARALGGKGGIGERSHSASPTTRSASARLVRPAATW